MIDDRSTMAVTSKNLIGSEASTMTTNDVASVERKKNIVLIPRNAVGHVNGLRGAIYSSLASSDQYRMIVILEKTYQGQMEPYGFEEMIYELSSETNQNLSQPGAEMAYDLMKINAFGKMSIEERLRALMDGFVGGDFTYDFYAQVDKCLKELSKQISIDLFIVDDTHPHPFTFFSDIPLIKCITGQPFVHAMEPDLPPPFTGLPSNCDPDVKQYYFGLLVDLFKNSKFHQFIEKLGYPPLPENWSTKHTRLAKVVYACPKELNHWKIETIPNWFNLEVFNKNPKGEKFDLEQLVGPQLFNDDLDGGFSGKWIYLSLGSMGSVVLDLMQRLIGTLAKTNHKYIVSKGPRHQEYDLARNMWGSGYVKQIKILPVVDLVITHGGNNTVTETFAQGKPMIVLPLIFDQFDNAQRVAETNFGARFDPHDYDEKELIDSIDNLLNDQQLKQRLEKASQRIQKSNAHQVFAKMVEEIVNGTAVDQD